MWRPIIHAILACCILHGTGCSPPRLSRPDALDRFVSDQDFVSLQTRRGAAPGSMLGYKTLSSVPSTSSDQHPFILSGPLQSIRVIEVDVPNEVVWESGTTEFFSMSNSGLDYSGRLSNVFAEANVRFGRKYTESIFAHGVSYLRLRPEWIRRRPARHQNNLPTSEPVIVTELMRVNGFTIVREYSSENTAKAVSELFGERLKGEVMSIGLKVDKSVIQVTVQTDPLIVGVKLQPLSEVAPEPQPVSRGNIRDFGYEPVAEFIEDLRQHSLFCDTAVLGDDGVLYGHTSKLRIADDIPNPVSIDTLPTTIRLDIVEDGKFIVSRSLANVLLDRISPADVAYAQASFARPTRTRLEPNARRAVDGGVDDAILLVSEAIGGDSYEVMLYFYDEGVAEDYAQSLQRLGVDVHYSDIFVRATYKRETPIAIAVKLERWGDLRLSADELRVDGSWLDGDFTVSRSARSPQQLVLLRARSPHVLCGETSPFVEAQPGSTQIIDDTLKGRQVRLISAGRQIASAEFLRSVFGSINTRGISSAHMTVRSSVSAVINPSRITRREPRGVWIDTSSEHIVTNAASINAVDVVMTTANQADAERIERLLRSRFPQAEFTRNGTHMSVRNAELHDESKIRLFRAVPLNSFISPKLPPNYRDAGTEFIDDGRYLNLGKSGFGVELLTPPHISWSFRNVRAGYQSPSFHAHLRLLVDGTYQGSPVSFESRAGYDRIVYFDVEHNETLEVKVEPVMVFDGGNVGARIQWRLIGKPEPCARTVDW